VFVGNLSFDTFRQELETAFSTVGRITDIVVPLDRVTNRPRGFAFVEFNEPGLTHKAIEQLDGVVLGGRPLRVSAARDRAPRPAFNRGTRTTKDPEAKTTAPHGTLTGGRTGHPRRHGRRAAGAACAATSAGSKKFPTAPATFAQAQATQRAPKTARVANRSGRQRPPRPSRRTPARLRPGTRCARTRAPDGPRAPPAPTGYA